MNDITEMPVMDGLSAKAKVEAPNNSAMQLDLKATIDPRAIILIVSIS